MAWDKGFDFRATSGFVTDPTDHTYVIGTDSYPTTRNSVTFGWESGFTSSNTRDRSQSVDPRLAGIHFEGATAVPRFRVDLPATGDYDIRAAFGDALYTQNTEFRFIDNTTALFSSTLATTDAGKWKDATDVTRTPSADWVANNAKRTETFASTIFRTDINYNGIDRASPVVIAHLFVSQVAGGVTKTVSDSGSGADALGGLLVGLKVSDAGLGSESLPIGAAVPVSDVGSGADAISILTALLKTISDAGSGSDGLSVAVALSVQESGQGSDAPKVSVELSVADVGSGTDAISVLQAILKTVADVGSGSDAPTVTVSLAVPDSGLGSDAPAILASLTVSDVGQGLDDVLVRILKAVADAAHGSDGLSVTVQVPVGDIGSGLDSLLLAALLQIIDIGHGADTITISGTGIARIITVTFSARKPAVTFAARQASVGFTARQPRVDFNVLN